MNNKNKSIERLGIIIMRIAYMCIIVILAFFIYLIYCIIVKLEISFTFMMIAIVAGLIFSIIVWDNEDRIKALKKQ